MTEKEKIELDIEDAIIGKPYWFELNEKRYALYPATLGKTIIVRRYIAELHINQKALLENPFVEGLRLAKEKRQICSTIISLATLRDRKQITNNYYVNLRSEEISSSASNEDIATLLILCLTKDQQYDTFIQHLGLDKEQERQRRVRKVKDTKNTFTFNGKSIYGTLIDIACERYGWTIDYVVWGISYINLQMLLADQITSILLTDKEREKCHISNDNEVIRADDPKNRAAIHELLKG